MVVNVTLLKSNPTRRVNCGGEAMLHQVLQIFSGDLGGSYQHPPFPLLLLSFDSGPSWAPHSACNPLHHMKSFHELWRCEIESGWGKVLTTVHTTLQLFTTTYNLLMLRSYSYSQLFINLFTTYSYSYSHNYSHTPLSIST